MTADDWLKLFWLPLSVTLIGGLSVAGLLAIPYQAVRVRFWKPILRWLKWPLTLRLTTTARLAATDRETTEVLRRSELDARRFREVCELLDVTPVLPDSTLVPERIQRLQEASAEAWAHAGAEIQSAQDQARSNIAATRALAEEQIRESLRVSRAEAERVHASALEEGRAAGRAEAEAEVEMQRALLPVRPVWRIDEPEPGGLEYNLRNVQEGVEVRDVSVEADPDDFSFAGPTQARGPLEGSFIFLGSKNRHGSLFGVKFVVKWRDANGDKWEGVVKVDRDPRKAIVL